MAYIYILVYFAYSIFLDVRYCRFEFIHICPCEANSTNLKKKYKHLLYVDKGKPVKLATHVSQAPVNSWPHFHRTRKCL